jgi:hypothetical protein
VFGGVGFALQDSFVHHDDHAQVHVHGQFQLTVGVDQSEQRLIIGFSF